jgi:hypothetical protein
LPKLPEIKILDANLHLGFLMTRKVLAIGMYDSVHFSRWLAQFQDEDIEFLLFPSSPHRRLHPILVKLLANSKKAKFSLAPLSRFYGLPLWILDNKFFGNLIRGSLLRKLVSQFRPGIVHALEFQNAGYILLKAFEKTKPNGVSIILTNYGSDLFWFVRFPSHLEKIKKLLQLADVYAAECERDVSLARELGFKGRVMPIRPNAGGFSLQSLSGELTLFHQRHLIAIKGYHGWVGRAHIALDAITQISHLIRDYQIVVYSCNKSTIRYAKRCARETGLHIETYAIGKLSHEEMMELFGKSAIYVGISESDGISTSLLEAMAMGAVPVQTSTACCDEWFSEETGVAIKNIDAEEVSKGILRALELAKLGLAAKKNRETIRNKASESFVKEASLLYYR